MSYFKYLLFFFFLLSCPLFSFAQESLPKDYAKVEEILDQIMDDAFSKDLTVEEEDKIARRWRNFIQKTDSEVYPELILKAMIFPQIYGERVLPKYSISQEEFEENHFSVGVALSHKDYPNKDEIIDILIREAKFFGAAPLIKLILLYTYPTEGYPHYDPRILNLIKSLAEEGWAREQYEYGKILLEGIGIAPNKAEGLKFLEKSNIAQAHEYLALHYHQEHNMKKFWYYTEQAAALGSPQGLYNMGYREGENKNYPRAVELFKEALEMDPTYWNAQLELARFYIEGWGVEQDLDKAVQMLEEVIQKSDDLHDIQVAKANMVIAKERKAK